MSGAATEQGVWDEVWAEYDRRAGQPIPAFEPPSLPPRPRPELLPEAGAARRRRRPGLLAFGVTMLLLGLCTIGAPHLVAWHVAGVVEGRDVASLARRLEVSSLQPGIREGLARAAKADLGGDAAAYLTGMAEEMLEAWQDPAAVAEVMRARGMDAPRAAPRPEPVGLLRYRLGFGEAHAPVMLEIELRDWLAGPRWRVVGVRLDRARPEAEPMRLSAAW